MSHIATIDWQLPALWVALTAALVLMGIVTRRAQRRPLAELLIAEDGAGYTISLMLCLPLYTFLIAALIETTLLIIVGIGMRGAAHAAARSATVWLAAECSAETKRDQIRAAAVHAITPFASWRHLPKAELNDAQQANAAAYVTAFAAYGRNQRLLNRYLPSKYEYALNATAIRWEPSRSAFELVYEAPIQVPGIGPFLGRRVQVGGRTIYTRQMTLPVSVAPETPTSSSQTMGIRYGDPH